MAMTPEQYRARAEEAERQARDAADPIQRRECLEMASSWHYCAQQAALDKGGPQE